MRDLKFGVIGCGAIGRRHCNLLWNNEINNAKLIAVCDNNKSSANSYASYYNVKKYYNIIDMVNSGCIDAFVICTPSGMHVNNVCEITKNNVIIILEKPISLKITDADIIINHCSINKIKLFVVKQNRFNRPVKRLHHAIENNILGKIVMATIRLRWCRNQKYYDQAEWRGTWEHDGGVIMNQTIHYVDLLLWLIGDIYSVYALGINGLANIQAEDTAIVAIKFKNGAIGVIEATTATRPTDLECSMSVLSEKGTIVIGGYAVNELITWKCEEYNKIHSSDNKNPEHKYGYAHKEFYNYVINCIKNKTNHSLDGINAKKSLRIVHSIYESIDKNKEVIISDNVIYEKLGSKT